MKILYILLEDCGDGSHCLNYTFDYGLVQQLQVLDNEGKLDYDDIGMNGGDGFDYDTLTVPDECTYESLGIRPIDPDYLDKFSED